jgi:hypothetical protein
MLLTLSVCKRIFEVVRFSASHFDLKQYMKINYGFHGTAPGVPGFRETGPRIPGFGGTASGVAEFRGPTPVVPVFGAPPRLRL